MHWSVAWHEVGVIKYNRQAALCASHVKILKWKVMSIERSMKRSLEEENNSPNLEEKIDKMHARFANLCVAFP